VGQIALIVLAVALCFFGFKLYRLLFSMIIFLAVMHLSCTLLNEVASWKEIVTCFSVCGVVTAAIAYHWNKLGGMVVATLIAAGMLWSCNESIKMLIYAVVLAALFVHIFPVLSISFFTTFGGAWMLKELDKFPWDRNTFVIFVIVVVLFQMLMNRKQSIFTKTYFNKFKQWRKNKRERKYADSFS
jgi:hypothetical protein